MSFMTQAQSPHSYAGPTAKQAIPALTEKSFFPHIHDEVQVLKSKHY